MLVFLLWAAVAWLLVTRQGIAGKKKTSGAEQCLG
jgi:hypothetical protein